LKFEFSSSPAQLPPQVIHYPRPPVRSRFSAIGASQNHPVNPITEQDRPALHLARPEAAVFKSADGLAMRRHLHHVPHLVGIERGDPTLPLNALGFLSHCAES